MFRELIFVTIVLFGFDQARTNFQAELQIGVKDISKRTTFPCPDPFVIDPCVCAVKDGGLLQLDCSDIQSDEDLARVFQQEFPVKEFWRFYIMHNDKIQQLTDIFNGVTFRDISLIDVPNLTFLSDNLLFESRSVLEGINILESQLSEDTFFIPVLSIYTKLKYLMMSHSNFTYIPRELESESLNNIGFTSGSISTLPAGE